MAFPPPPGRFPPPPGGGFAPPPPGGGFAPPPPPGAGGFAPPQPHGGGFAPPPPGGSRGFAPPPGAGGFAPPPPGAGGFAPPPPGQPFPPQPGNMQQLNAGMNNMSMQPPPPQASRQAPGMFTPNPANVGGPPPGPVNFHSPPGGNAGGPKLFQPAAPGPHAPQMMSMSGHPPGAPHPGGAEYAPTAPGTPGSAPAMANENIDYSVTIPDRLIRWATTKLPQTANHANVMKIPMGAVLRPLAPEGPDEDPVDTVEPGTAGIVRCKRCRTYINAFVSWSEHGRRWRCNICGQINDTHSAYFCHLDDQGLRRDRFDRPELSKGVVEFIAPPEYMVRPPQEPSYFFVIDVSASAVRSGMVAAAARSIKLSLDELPGRGRTKIGFITFDYGVHYYNLSSGLPSAQMLVVSDLKELFVPLPDDLLVNLEESRSVVESFLDNLPDMFAQNPVAGQSCLGPALKAAFTVMKQIGGKMCVFQSIIPNLGDGALRPRDKPGLVGTPNEIKLLKADSTWYKDTAIEFSRQQISVDMFLFPYQYLDFAALGELPKFTSGSLYSYPFYNSARDGPQFESQLNKCLTQTTAFEAVMRIRCTKGMRITNFYGNFFIRGTDLLALPNCNTDSVFAFDLAHEEQSIPTSHVTIQAALLYTSSDGERRIRVMTKALPASGLLSDVMKSIDVDTACALLAKQALDMALKSNLDNARMRLQQICVEAIRASKSGDKRTVSGYAAPPAQSQQGAEDDARIPENLSLLPLYTLAMMKNVAFRGGTDVHPDERVQAHHTLNSLWVDKSKNFIYPRMFAIHNMGQDVGHPISANTAVEDDQVAGRHRILLPSAVNLSADRLSSDGVFLLDNGVEFFLWVGRSADINIMGSLFGVHSLDDMDPNSLKVSTSGDDFSSRFGAIVNGLREDPADPFVICPKIRVIREGDPHMEDRFFWFMVEDRASFQGGTYNYDEFMSFVQNPNSSAGGGRQAPPGAPGPGAPMAHPGPPGQPHTQQPNRGMPPQHHGMQPPGAGMPPHPPGPGMQLPGMPPPPGPGRQPPPPGPGMHQPPPGPGMHQPPPGPGMHQPPPGPGMHQPPQGPGMHQPPQGPGMQPPSGPSSGPPPGSYAPPPGQVPPNSAPVGYGHGGPPPQQPGGFGGPPTHGPPGGGPPQYQQPSPVQQAPPAGYGMPPPRAGAMPPPPGRSAPPGPPPRGMPPPRAGMPPPPPPR